MESQLRNCMEHVGEVLHVLRSSNQYEETVHLIVDRIVRVYKAQTCAVVLIDPQSEYLSIENSIGLSHTFCKAFRRKLAVGTIGEVIWTGKSVLISHRHHDQKIVDDVRLEHPFESCTCIQIAVDHRTLGYLHVDSKEPNAFDKLSLQLLQAYADLVGIAINKSRLYDENLRLDTTDSRHRA